MKRDHRTTTNKIALLATGDEVSNGDIPNSNGQVIAQKLFKNGMNIGTHLVVPDTIFEIEQAIHFLLNTHRAIIMTGGLGPTSDDVTRYALSKAVNKPLVFDDQTWNAICERFKILGYQGEPPEGNQQQALFPNGANIIHNPHGTAAGCKIEHNGCVIFMLPGPPYECLPMVDQHVLPYLKQNKFPEMLFFENWLLFGIGESAIASELDQITKPFACTTGYRLAYPYIEFKIFSNNETDFKAALPLIKKALQPYLLNDGKQPASLELKNRFMHLQKKICIKDTATGGLLESILKNPDTFPYLSFDAASADISIEGLTEFWHGQDAAETALTIQFANGSKKEKMIPLRGRQARVQHFAVEWLCQQIMHVLAAN